VPFKTCKTYVTAILDEVEAEYEISGGYDWHLHGFPRAQANISKELGRSRSGKKNEGLVLLGVLWADHVSVGPAVQKSND